jgi:hypothetical protein
MNLHEEVSRIKTIMGLIKEEVDGACELKNINLNTLESYWTATTKTEQEKITEVENFVKPIFTDAKNYMLNYIESDWFNKKVQEKIDKGPKFDNYELEIYNSVKRSLTYWQEQVKKLENTDNEELTKAKKRLEFFSNMVKEKEAKLQGVITSWGQTQKNELKNFLNSVILVFDLTCSAKIGGFVYEDDYSKLYFCTKNVFPNEINKNEVLRILVHEFNHCLSFYFIYKSVDYLPEDAKGPQLVSSTDANYGNSSFENASRVQNLKRLLGVTDFGTLDNFIKLIKDNVKLKDTANLIYNPVYENNIMKIPFNGLGKKNVTLLSFNFFINDTNARDVKLLFYTQSKTVEDGYNSYIEVDLNKIYNYAQEFAKTNTSSDLNYT